MAKLVFGMNLSLDGYVDHQKFAPGRELFRHWIEQVRGLTGCVYGRRLYEIMRYWDEDQPNWYRLYFRPVVLGRGKPFFVGARPALRFVASERIGDDAIRLTYVPA